MRALVAIVLLGACDAYDKDIGPAPFFCGPDEPRCPMGYTCMHDPTSGADVCGTPIAWSCADDSALEPNNTLPKATATPVDTMASFTQAAAICPPGDIDTFAISLGANGKAVEATVTFDGKGAVLHGAILNEGGVPVAEATSVDATTIHAAAPSLSKGTYYIQIDGPTIGRTQNNYQLTVSVTGP